MHAIIVAEEHALEANPLALADLQLSQLDQRALARPDEFVAEDLNRKAEDLHAPGPNRLGFHETHHEERPVLVRSRTARRIRISDRVALDPRLEHQDAEDPYRRPG